MSLVKIKMYGNYYASIGSGKHNKSLDGRWAKHAIVRFLVDCLHICKIVKLLNNDVVSRNRSLTITILMVNYIVVFHYSFTEC